MAHESERLRRMFSIIGLLYQESNPLITCFAFTKSRLSDAKFLNHSGSIRHPHGSFGSRLHRPRLYLHSHTIFSPLEPTDLYRRQQVSMAWD